MCNPFDNFRNKIVFYGNDFNACEYVCPTKDEVINLVKNDFEWYGIDTNDTGLNSAIDMMISSPMYPFTKAGGVRDELKRMMPNARFNSFNGHSPLDYRHALYNFQYNFLGCAYDTGEPNEKFSGSKNCSIDEFVATVLKIANSFYPYSNIKGEVAIRKAIETYSDNLAIKRADIQLLANAISMSFVQRTKTYPGRSNYRNYAYTSMNKKIQYAVCHYFDILHSGGLERLNDGEIINALHDDLDVFLKK